MKRPKNSEPLSFPADLTPFVVGTFVATPEEMRAAFGEPGYIETEPSRTAGGIEESWAWQLPWGQRVLLVLDIPMSTVAIYCDPPDIAPVLFAFQIEPERRVEAMEEPLFMGRNRPVNTESTERTWALFRQDDHGNHFVVKTNITREQGERLAAAMGEGGHKQIFWVEQQPRKE